jgi:hypothetical protein
LIGSVYLLFFPLASQSPDDPLVGENIVMKQLALWTILVLRWPVLAEYLEVHPEKVEQIGKPLPNEVPETEHLRELFQNDEVRDVIKGKGIGISLDKSAIQACACLRTRSAGVP